MTSTMGAPGYTPVQLGSSIPRAVIGSAPTAAAGVPGAVGAAHIAAGYHGSGPAALGAVGAAPAAAVHAGNVTPVFVMVGVAPAAAVYTGGVIPTMGAVGAAPAVAV